MESAEQPHIGAVQKISDELNKAGHAVTPSAVNPEDDSPLKKITEETGNMLRFTGAHLEDQVYGGNETGRVQTVSTGNRKFPAFINMVRQRFLTRQKEAA